MCELTTPVQCAVVSTQYPTSISASISSSAPGRNTWSYSSLRQTAPDRRDIQYDRPQTGANFGPNPRTDSTVIPLGIEGWHYRAGPSHWAGLITYVRAGILRPSGLERSPSKLVQRYYKRARRNNATPTPIYTSR